MGAYGHALRFLHLRRRGVDPRRPGACPQGMGGVDWLQIGLGRVAPVRLIAFSYLPGLLGSPSGLDSISMLFASRPAQAGIDGYHEFNASAWRLYQYRLGPCVQRRGQGAIQAG